MAARLVQFFDGIATVPRIGVQIGVNKSPEGKVVDEGQVVDVTKIDGNIPNDMLSFVNNWDTNLAAALK